MDSLPPWPRDAQVGGALEDHGKQVILGPAGRSEANGLLAWGSSPEEPWVRPFRYPGEEKSLGGQSGPLDDVRPLPRTGLYRMTHS